MNFLAHTFLSCRDEKLLIGNFLGDFVKNKDLSNYDGAIQSGIFLHRKIDVFTDNHPIVKIGTRRLHQKHGKYAPVIVDIYYDHFLSVNWSLYSNQTLPDFAQRVYAILKANFHLFPEKEQARIQAMVDDEWLNLYGSLDGLEVVFSRMGKRLSRPAQMKGVVETLQNYYNDFNADFKEFFPTLMNFVENECKC